MFLHYMYVYTVLGYNCSTFKYYKDINKCIYTYIYCIIMLNACRCIILFITYGLQPPKVFFMLKQKVIFLNLLARI